MGSSDPKLAIVTASFNRMCRLERLHRSLHRQTETLEWIHVVVDDNSNPAFDLRDIFPSCNNLVFWRNSVNFGPLITRNIALDIALSREVDLVAFIDDDDYVKNNFFSYIKRIWKNQKDIGWYVTRNKFVGDFRPKATKWPDTEGVFYYANDLQLKPKFTSDVAHVISATRIKQHRFSRLGRNQREWTLLAKVARGGGFYASNDCFKIQEYLKSGITYESHTKPREFFASINYLHKAFVIVSLSPFSRIAWMKLVRQLIVFPVRILVDGCRSFTVMFICKSYRTKDKNNGDERS